MKKFKIVKQESKIDTYDDVRIPLKQWSGKTKDDDL